MPKLYEVEIVRFEYVLADDEGEAIRKLSGAYLSGDPEMNPREVTLDWPRAEGWTDDCLVYGAEDDTLLGDVWPKAVE